MGIVLEVTSDIIAALIAEAACAGSAECCGLLLGRGNRVEQVRPAANIAENPSLRFEIDPAALFAAHREARTGGRELIGYYHSHPRGHPVPSPTDCAHASGDRRVWAIVAVEEVAFWRDGEDGFEALSYIVVDG
jgi:proteasome lid subunit RPN8/RPN11